MPIFDHNTQIHQIYITNDADPPVATQIHVVRLGGQALFPDMLGAPIIETFIQSATTVTSVGGNISLTITGTEGAEWSIAVSFGSLNRSSGTLGSTGTDTITWTIGGHDGNQVNRTATISAQGTSILEEGLNATATVQQSAALANGISTNYSGPANGINLGFLQSSGLPQPIGNYTVFGNISNSTVSAFGSATVTNQGASGGGTQFLFTVTGGSATGNRGGIRITRPGYRTFSQNWFEWGIE